METKLIQSAILAGTLLFAASTFASTTTDPDFAKLDSNRDGLIAWSEFLAQNPRSGRLDPRVIFDNVDSNRDGYIDQNEFASMKRRRNRA